MVKALSIPPDEHEQAGDTGLKIIDVADPSNPILLATVPPRQLKRLCAPIFVSQNY